MSGTRRRAMSSGQAARFDSSRSAARRTRGGTMVRRRHAMHSKTAARSA
jgi:hypothetical protein